MSDTIMTRRTYSAPTSNALKEPSSDAGWHQLPVGVQQAAQPADRFCPDGRRIVAKGIAKGSELPRQHLVCILIAGVWVLQ